MLVCNYIKRGLVGAAVVVMRCLRALGGGGHEGAGGVSCCLPSDGACGTEVHVLQVLWLWWWVVAVAEAADAKVIGESVLAGRAGAVAVEVVSAECEFLPNDHSCDHSGAYPDAFCPPRSDFVSHDTLK